MSNRISILCIAVIFLLITTNAFAAGVIQLPRTGQTKCYRGVSPYDEIPCAGTGQDGEMQAGVAWPNPRFTVGTGVEADCVTDNLTGLMWSKNGNLPNYTLWNDAIDFANNLTLCGYTDWRLPNVNELESLVNAGVLDLATWFNSNGFTNVQSDRYWSSTTSADITSDAWYVYMSDGLMASNTKSLDYYSVWPVRSGQVGGSSGYLKIWMTGQTISYRLGDDGDLEMGVAWSNPRFTVGTDIEADCVTDNLTGLMWSKNANLAGLITWNAALNYANNLTFCGYSDWRLPNIKELKSLIDYSRNSSGLPFPFYNDNVLTYKYHWSSTTCVDSPDTDYAWTGSMVRIGIVGCDLKDRSGQYVWPVRLGSFDYYCDNDSDGYISSTVSDTCEGSGCVPSGCQTASGNDCDDNDASVNLGVTEGPISNATCGDGKDNDCDTFTDLNDSDCKSNNNLPDLVVTSVAFTPAKVIRGGNITVTHTTRNRGKGPAGGSATQYYLSKDNSKSRKDILLASYSVSALDVAASSSGNTTVTIPANTSRGIYYTIACADNLKQVAESNEKNNCRASGKMIKIKK
jgi:hypothetical protein